MSISARRLVRLKSTGFAMVFFRALMSCLICGSFVHQAHAKKHAWSPWHSKNTSIVLDGYAYTPIDWSKLRRNKRLAGFINKASDGLVEPWRCKGSELQQNYCKVRWRRYKAEHELFLTRRHLAKAMGLKWGSYHLARPGNPTGQALHYIKYADPQPDDLIALDIEHNDPKKWMSLKDAEVFARVIKMKLGRYPVLYTNHDTAKFIAANRDKYKLLSRLNLWYARFNDRIPGVFPMGHWPNYTIWQFSAIYNCTKKRCLYRVPGTDRTVDVNVVPMSVATLQRKWPFDDLTAKINPKKKKPKVSQPKAKEPSPVLVSSYAPNPARSASMAAIGSLLASKPEEKTQSQKDSDVKIVMPPEIEQKAGEMVARLVDRMIDNVSVATIPTRKPNTDDRIAPAKQRQVHTVSLPASKLPGYDKKPQDDVKLQVEAHAFVLSTDEVRQRKKSVEKPALENVIFRSLDSAPKFNVTPKPLVKWRTSDDVRSSLSAR